MPSGTGPVLDTDYNPNDTLHERCGVSLAVLVRDMALSGQTRLANSIKDKVYWKATGDDLSDVQLPAVLFVVGDSESQSTEALNFEQSCIGYPCTGIIVDDASAHDPETR